MAGDRQFDVILFDLEGTLVDFQWRLKEAVSEILQVLLSVGIDPERYGELPDYASLYNTVREITREWAAQDAARLFDRFSVIYDKYDRDALSRWAVYPDTSHTLARISDYGYRMGVVSNCGAHAVDAVLEKFSLTGYFEIALARNDIEYLKPHPQGLELALEKLCVPAARALFVGDSLNDILAAEQVPMPSCFLASGESRVTGTDADSATFQISSLSNLADILIQ